MQWHTVTHGRESEGETGEWSGQPAPFALPRNMVYPALLPLMRAPRLTVVDRTDAHADLNGLVRFAERRNLVSARVPSHFNPSLTFDCIITTAIQRTCCQLYLEFHFTNKDQRTYILGLDMKLKFKLSGFSYLHMYSLHSDATTQQQPSLEIPCLNLISAISNASQEYISIKVLSQELKFIKELTPKVLLRTWNRTLTL